ncbi:hypothetical protein [Corynebacterium pygosceleis]|uniref:hypothetical protein n=1 Tax=Corynebacterium pygosceleis TaxID=2800406 RepID=UPI001903FCA8|nr:hypothetical protein [Corynebacterium pygosceleis]MCL0119554.1 hypothetical protein [Corynebacterium pygosceleis]
MEPMEINGGRFYARPLHDDDRIDDRPALGEVFGRPVDPDFVEGARADWASDTVYTWAVCEQTSVSMLALATLTLHGDGGASLDVRRAGDPGRMLPNDPALPPKSVGDGVIEGRGTIERWAHGYCGLELR